jgi:hypothetical protein
MRLLDNIPVKKAFKLDMEIWDWADTKLDYAVGTFWYARPGATHNRLPQPGEASQALMPTPTATRIAGAIECENLKVLAKTDGLTVNHQENYPFDEGSWSGDAQLFVQAREPGDFIELRLGENVNGPKKITLYGTKSYDYGILRLSINGQVIDKLWDGYAPNPVLSGPIELGTFTPKDGQLVLRIEVTGANPAAKATKSYFGLDCVTLKAP